MPDEANVGQEHAPQVALVGREVPHSLDLLCHFQGTAEHVRRGKGAEGHRLTVGQS